MTPQEAEVEVARLKADVRAAYAERDEMWERKAAALQRAGRAEAERDALKAEVGRLVIGRDEAGACILSMGAELEALKAAATDALVVLTGDLIGNPVLPENRKVITDRLDVALDATESHEDTPTATPVKHIGGRANAEDCPACTGTNPPYPFICPGNAPESPAPTATS